ncbi:MAG: hypothetical protein M3Z36_05215 [Acidobacteriota bacterium]|nr:hypothetical protein [Acidobacteriota bacterium]
MADVPTNPWRAESDYVIWEAPKRERTIRVRTVAMQGIKNEVLESTTGDPQTFQEVGGLLLGRKVEGQLIIDDFEPVPCEHRIDHGYHLSASDREALQETVQWFEGGAVPGVSVVGFYRSHIRYGLFFSEEDHKLLARYLPSVDHAFLLLKPRQGEVLCNFYFWRDGQLVSGDKSDAVEPARIPAATEPQSDLEIESVQKASPRTVTPALVSFDPKPSGKNWVLRSIIAAGLILLAAFLYSTFRDRPAPFPKTSQTVRTPSNDAVNQQPSALSKPSAFRDKPPGPQDNAPEQTMRIKMNPEPERLSADEEIAAEDPIVTSQVKTLLFNWADALKRGDENAFVAFYAPQLSTYFTKRDVSQEVVRKSVEVTFLRYGSFRICEIGNIKVTPLGPDRAVAVFRKKWAAADADRFAGEELERCQLARYGTDWKIASEQEIKLYWVRK